MSLNCCIIGTDTEVGKTHVVRMLCKGLRQLDRTVWVHKPIACGDWRENQAEDGRVLSKLADPGQDPALVCPLQFPRSASPHLAAASAKTEVFWKDMSTLVGKLKGKHDLIVEGAGGLLAPLSTDGGCIGDICKEQNIPCLLVTRPHLGTLNHTQLTVREARRQGLDLLGIVINHHEDHLDLESLSISTAKAEIERLCDLPVLAEIPYSVQFNHELAQRLAETLLARHATS